MSKRHRGIQSSSGMGSFVSPYKGTKGTSGLGTLAHTKKASTAQLDFSSPVMFIDEHTGVEAQAVIAGRAVDWPNSVKDGKEILSALGIWQKFDEQPCCGPYCERSPYFRDNREVVS